MNDEKRQERGASTSLLIFGVVEWLSISVVAAYTANLYLSYARETGTWQRTQGSVYESRLRGCDRKDRCNIVVSYRYNVGRRTYESKKISPFETRTYGPRQAEEKLAQYYVGSQVNVFYNPNDPASACLEGAGEVARLVYITLGISGLGVIFIFGMTYKLFRKRRTVSHTEEY